MLSIEVYQAYTEVLHPASGFRLTAGYRRGVLSSLSPGTLDLPFYFGNLLVQLLGVQLLQSVGPFAFEVSAGKPLGSLASIAIAASPMPLVAARVAYVRPSFSGVLFNTPFPLTVGVSGAVWQQRAGAGEKPLTPDAAPPVIEDLWSYLASAEVFVPIAFGVSFSTEGYYGQGVGDQLGAIGQGARVTLVTGAHTPLRSAGGWAQLVWNIQNVVELRIIGGFDLVLDGLGAGLSPVGAPAIEWNRKVAANLSWFPFEKLRWAIGVHAIQTHYVDESSGTGTTLAFISSVALSL